MRLVGIGSPHGDDQAGWEAVRQIQPQLPVGAEAAVLADPLNLLECLDGCTCLVVVDACRSGAAPGTVVRLAGAVGRWVDQTNASSHGFDVAAVLALAEALGKLPPRVVLIGVEAAASEPGAAIGPAVDAALPELNRLVHEELARQRDGAAEGRSQITQVPEEGRHD